MEEPPRLAGLGARFKSVEGGTDLGVKAWKDPGDRGGTWGGGEDPPGDNLGRLLLRFTSASRVWLRPVQISSRPALRLHGGAERVGGSKCRRPWSSTSMSIWRR